MVDKLSKSAVGYVRKPPCEYICAECVAYDPEDRRCLYLSPLQVVLPFDGCNYFIKGEPESILPKEAGLDEDGDSAMDLINLEEAGFARSNFGFTCGRCVNFQKDTFSCKVVEGEIYSDACCNAWSPDERRQLPREALDSL